MIIQAMEITPIQKGGIELNVEPSCGKDAYHHTIQLLKMIDSLRMAKIEFFTVLDSVTEFEGVPCNVYPPIIENKRKAWLYVDANKTRQRAVILARITQEDKVRYLFDIQRRLEKANAMVVLWRDTGEIIPDRLMSILVMDCAHTESIQL